MKKTLIWMLVIFLSINPLNAFKVSKDLESKIEDISSSFEEYINIHWESYKDIILEYIDNYKDIYSHDEEILFKLQYIEKHLQWVPQKPNIFLIIADDMWLDASPWYDNLWEQKPLTPHLDELAENWLVFENVWANPLCSPTRSSILTWKYGFRTWVLWALWKNDAWVSTEEISIQKVLSENSPYNYSQAVIWKWHLGTNNNGSDDNPELMWVPHYSWFLSWWMQDFYSWRKTTNGKSENISQYSTSEFSNDSISWINENQDNPWFLWLAFTAPHTPFHTPPKDLLSSETIDSINYDAIQEEIDSNPLPYYLAAIEAIDSEVWRIIASLSQEDKDNTIFIFMWDNGTPWQVAQSPYNNREVKGSIYKGWVHVPMIISWAWVEVWKMEEYVNSTDLFSTIAELSWVNIDTYEDSISFAPLLFWNERVVKRDFIYSEVQSASKNGWASAKNWWTVKKDGYQYISLDNGTEKLFYDDDLWQKDNLITELQNTANELKNLWEILRWDSPISYYNDYPEYFEDIVCYDDSFGL